MAERETFAFVQFEYGFPLGPADGRYLARPRPGAAPEWVLVLRTLRVPRRLRPRGRLGLRRRPRRANEAEPEPPPLARATLIRPTPFGSESQAREWLDGVRRQRDALSSEVSAAARELNEALRAHRAAAGDPYVREVDADRALAVRVGYGSGEQLADGRYTVAYEVPASAGRPRRRGALGPQERLAAVLSGQDQVRPSEELVLRARADLDAGRGREAALQARIALECLLAEAGGAAASLGADRGPVSQAANAALVGELSDQQREAVAGAVQRMEQALQRRGGTPLSGS